MNKNYKEKILKLRQQGKTYNQISKILGCVKSTVAYHANITTKKLQQKRINSSRKKLKVKLKQQLGGKCSKCGYSKCLDALDFHHVDPNKKLYNIGGLHNTTKKNILIEVKKCILICSNCHRELHSKNDIMIYPEDYII